MPLLLKFPLLRRCLSGVLVVVLSPEVQLERLMRRNGLSRPEAEAKVAAQLPAAEQRRLADHVIANDGDLEDLRRAVEAFRATQPEGWPAWWLAALGAVAVALCWW